MSARFCDNYRFLAKYNRWINERVLLASDVLGDEARKLDRGAFFGSIHRTLGHLLVADQIWLGRFATGGAAHGMRFTALEGEVLDLPDGCQLDTVLFDDWFDIKAKRLVLDVAIENWVAEMPGHFPELTMRYSTSKGIERAHPAWQAMTHFFNHQTHHRGQATTLISQAGGDVGVTDMIALV